MKFHLSRLALVLALVWLAGCATPPPAPPKPKEVFSADYRASEGLDQRWRAAGLSSSLLSREAADAEGNRLVSFRKLTLSLSEPIAAQREAVEALMAFAAQAERPMLLSVSVRTAEQQRQLVDWIRQVAARGGRNAVKLDVVRGPSNPLEVSVQYQY